MQPTAASALLAALMAVPLWAKPNISDLAQQCNSRGKQRACRELTKIALEDQDASVRRSAVANLTDQVTLATVAVHDTVAEVRLAAVANLTDQTDLAVIARVTQDPDVRQAAVAKLERVRQAAAAKLERDQIDLAKIAIEDNNINARYDAAGKIQDLGLLSKVADSEQNKRSRMDTIVELRKLLAESGVLQGPVWIQLRVGNQSAYYVGSGRGVSVQGESVDISIIRGESTVLAHKTWGAYLPNRLPAGSTATTSFDPGVDLADLLVALCRSEHCSESQVLLKIAAKGRRNWYGAMAKLRGGSDYRGATALHWAASEGDKKWTALLLANGADANARDYGNTPLHEAAAPLGGERDKNHMEVAELLLANGADINARNDEGWTPLHKAVYSGNKDMAELLLSHGADVNAKTSDGWTAFHLAESPTHDATLAELLRELLRQHGGHE